MDSGKTVDAETLKFIESANDADLFVKRAMPTIGALVGVVMLTFGLVHLFTVVNDGDIRISDIAAPMVSIIMGSVTIGASRRSIVSVVGMYSIGLGLSRIIVALESFITYDRYGIGVASSAIYLYAFVTLCLSVSCFYSGYCFCTKRSRRTYGLKISGACFSSMYLLIGYALVLRGEKITELLYDYPNIFFYMMQFLVLFCLLESNEIRMNLTVEKNVTKMDRIRSTYVFDPYAGIGPSEAEVLSKMFEDRSGWNTDVHGPVECEYRFDIRNGYRRTYFIIQKWKGDGKMHFTVTDRDDESILLANRFDIVHSYIEDDGKDGVLVMYRPDGSNIRLPIRPLVNEDIPEAKLEVLNCHY
ncbi:MAG: hypothetical protein MJZ68_05075 [archaeon]|nr:hypothetical protein [archaeon]